MNNIIIPLYSLNQEKNTSKTCGKTKECFNLWNVFVV